MIKQLDTPLYEHIEAKFEIMNLRAQDERLAEKRREAYAKFNSLGFPSIKNEEWRFTNILPFIKDEFNWDASEDQLSAEDLEKTAELVANHLKEIQKISKEEQKDAYHIVMVNGKMNKELSVLPPDEMVKVSNFGQSSASAESFHQYFGTIASLEGNAFAALNTALFNEGVFIEVPKNTNVDKPLHIVHVYLSTANLWIQPRQLVVLHPSSSLETIETVIADDAANSVFVNGVTEISIAENAHFHHYDLQTGREKMRFIQRIEATQQKHSNYSNYTFTLPGADFVRNNLTLHLDDVDLESHMYGLYLTADKQLVDNHTEVHHKKPHGESNQLYKGVLMDKSKAVFNGKIFVYEDAQKVNAFQQSNNILLDEKASVNAKPQLEIFADDVKCSHGTTIGQLDQEAMFYLQTRGIGATQAKTLLVNAFAFDVTQKVENAPLRTYLESRIASEITKP